MEFGRGAFWNSRNIWRYFPRPGWWGNVFFFKGTPKDEELRRTASSCPMCQTLPSSILSTFNDQMAIDPLEKLCSTRRVPVGKPEFPANSGHPNRRLNVKYPRSFNGETTHQQRTMIWSTLRPSWSLFHKLRCRKVPISFLLKVFFSCLSFVRPWPCTWFHVMRFCILCNICTLGLDRWMMGCSWS